MPTDEAPGEALVAAYGSYGCTADLVQGIELPSGRSVRHEIVEPIIAAYRRMIRDLAFDICELAPMTYLMARSRGAPLMALPVFLSRDFHHADILCRSDAGISGPADLAGKRFGVRAYTVTTGIWIRGMLQDQFGIDPASIEWVVDDEDHIDDIVLPANVTRLPAGRSIADAFADGEIHATVKGIAGAGRKGDPMRSWTHVDLPAREDPNYHDLFDDPLAVAAEGYATSAVYPMHRTVVLTQGPRTDGRFPEELFEAFRAAKDRYVDELFTTSDTDAENARYRALASIVGGDPLPYGVDDNLAAIEKLAELGVREGFLPSDIDAVSMFYPFDAP